MAKGILKTVDNINRTEGKVEIWECILGGSIGGGYMCYYWNYFNIYSRSSVAWTNIYSSGIDRNRFLQYFVTNLGIRSGFNV